jgi:hypothetical protein
LLLLLLLLLLSLLTLLLLLLLLQLLLLACTCTDAPRKGAAYWSNTLPRWNTMPVGTAFPTIRCVMSWSSSMRSGNCCATIDSSMVTRVWHTVP